MLRILPSGAKLVITESVVRPDSRCACIGHPDGNFCFFIWPSCGKLIIKDQLSGRVAFAPIVGLRAVSFYFYILPPDRSLYAYICFSSDKFMLLNSASGREAYFFKIMCSVA